MRVPRQDEARVQAYVRGSCKRAAAMFPHKATLFTRDSYADRALRALGREWNEFSKKEDPDVERLVSGRQNLGPSFADVAYP